METGEKDLKIHGDEVHYRIKPGPEENWQDSVVLIWYDLNNGLGGVHRIGNEPHAGPTGMATTWNNLIFPEGIYKKCRYQPLRPEIDFPPNGAYHCGDDTFCFHFDKGEHIWKIKDTTPDGEIGAELRFRDSGPNVDCFPKKETANVASAHFDIAGTVSGWMKIGDKKREVNGLGIRDHGWGPRDWDSWYTHRWVMGTFGANFSFVAMSMYGVTEQMHAFGWVVRDWKVTMAKTVDILMYVEIDGATSRGGHVKMELTTGEVLDIECTPIPKRSIVSENHDIYSNDRLCTFICGDLEGFCDWESTQNTHHGKRRPKKYFNGLLEDGWYPEPE